MNLCCCDVAEVEGNEVIVRGKRGGAKEVHFGVGDLQPDVGYKRLRRKMKYITMGNQWEIVTGCGRTKPISFAAPPRPIHAST